MFKKLSKFIGLGLIILAVIALMMRQGWLISVQRGLQNKFYDYDSASSEIVIVSIDEKSLKDENLGAFTQWKREYYAQAIDALNSAGAAAIGIDVTFPDTSAHGKIDDEVLRDTIKKYDNVVIAGRYYFDNGIRQTDLPNATILEAEPKMGWINVQLDDDGFVRTVPLFAATKDKTVEAFSLQIARTYLKVEPVDYRITGNAFHFSEKTVIPTMTKTDSKTNQDVHLMYVNYFAEPNKFTRISFVDLINGKFVDTYGNAIDLKDKIVLIGPTAIDLQDDYLTPVSQGVKMPGVEIHANNIQTINEGKFLRDQSRFSLWLTLLILLAVNITLFAVLKIRYTLPLMLIEAFGFLVAGIITYEFRIFLNVIYPISVIVLSFVGTYLLRFIVEQKERKFIEGAFGHYVNKDIVRQIQRDPKSLVLGGIKRDITVFFSDIEGFTSLSEKLEPNEMVSFLNEYLQEMTEIILKYKGTLDKYEGDAIMAFWNAPIALHDHPLNACLAALENQSRLAELRVKWAKEGKPQISARIGINTGDAVVGNMGSRDRFDYTAMGDDVNLGSRLEGINKQYGTKIIISESTYKNVGDKLLCRELDLIRVKGKNEPVRIYELIGKKDAVDANIQKAIDVFASALVLYRQKNFLAAKQIFESIKNDPPSEVLAKRCDEFIKNPPAGDWDGVWTFTTK